ncbi:putative reverse transcriptase domain-containing protein [Tanacetum coccineum]
MDPLRMFLRNEEYVGGNLAKDKNCRDDNKRTRTGNDFATTVNPVGRENTGTWPKCTIYNSFHAPGGLCRICYNSNRPGHLARDCRSVSRNVNPINARNPTIRARYECGSTDHIRPVFPSSEEYTTTQMEKKTSALESRRETERESEIFMGVKKQEEIVVARDFPEVFPDDLSGLPPTHEIKFRIELIPRASR